jgi:hypothetical protein
MKKSINVWERVKRIVAHSFNLETKQEIRERIQKAQEEEIQQQLRLQHQKHVEQLQIEYRDQIEAYHKERKEQLKREQEEREREERIRLYRDNRPLQDKILYREVKKDVFEALAEESQEQ